MNDVVNRGGTSYIAIAATTGNDPPASPTKWQIVAAKGTDGATGQTGGTGPAGPPGTFSTANVTVRTQGFNGLATGTANCLAGEKAISGGFDWTGGNRNILTNQAVVTGGTPTGWTVTLSGTVTTGTVQVTCVS